jgi:hypothetical protein
MAPTTLSLEDLKMYIKNHVPDKVKTPDTYTKYLLYYLNMAQLVFYGDTLGKDMSDSLDVQKAKLQKIYDDLKLSYGADPSFSSIFNTLPNPRDILYFASGNRDDLMKPYDDAAKTLSSAATELTPSKSSLQVHPTINPPGGPPIYDYDKDWEMQHDLL